MLSTIRSCEQAVLAKKADVDISVVWKNQIEQLKSAIAAAAAGGEDNDHKKKTKLALLWDLEGTVVPLYFVTRSLFPYFDSKMCDFAAKNITSEVIQAALDGRRRARDGDASKDDKGDDAAFTDLVTVVSGFIEHVRSGAAAEVSSPVTKELLEMTIQADEIVLKLPALPPVDGKAPPRHVLPPIMCLDAVHNSAKNLKVPYFKKFQGLVWRQAYETGEIKGHLFSDFGRLLERCSTPSIFTGGVTNHIFSSGSVPAQKLLVSFSSAGDISKNIVSYNDTVTAGNKFDAASYKKIIANSLGGDSDTVVVFLSDSVQELKAARAAGCVTVLAVRPQNPQIPAELTEEEAAGSLFDASLFSCEQLGSAIFGPSFVSGRSELAAVLKDVERYDAAADGERKVF